jgi:hypothetical protein
LGPERAKEVDRQCDVGRPHDHLGDKAFIAGADINEVATDTPVEAEQKTRLDKQSWT